MNWLFYALASALSVTVFSLLIKKFLDQEKDEDAFAITNTFVGGIFLLVFMIFDTIFSKISPTIIGLIVIGSIICAIVNVFFTKGRKREDVSHVSIARQTSTIWTFFAGILFLGESLSLMKIFGIVLILFGNFLVLWEGKKLKITKGLFYIFAGAFLTGIGAIIDKTIIGRHLPASLYSGVIFLGASMWILLYTQHPLPNIVNHIKATKYKTLIAGLLIALNVYLVMKAIETGEVSKVMPIHNLSMVLSVLASILFLNEKDKIPQKIIGSIIAFCGIFFLI